MKRFLRGATIVWVVLRFGYRPVLMMNTLLLGALITGFATVNTATPYVLLLLYLALLGVLNSLQFTAMNTLTLSKLEREEASSGNSLLSVVMQLSMSLGVSVAGILIGVFAQQQVNVGSGAMHTAFLYCYMAMAVIIALPAWVFSRVPEDAQKNALIDRRRAAASSPVR